MLFKLAYDVHVQDPWEGEREGKNDEERGAECLSSTHVDSDAGDREVLRRWPVTGSEPIELLPAIVGACGR